MIRVGITLCVVAVLFTGCPAMSIARDTPAVIFDTDMGNDVDDVVALAMLHALQTRGECRIAAVTVSKDHDLAGPFVDVINTFYGRPEIPIGVVRDGPTPDAGKYLSLVNQFPHRLEHGADAPGAVAVLRSTLSKARDGSVIVIQVGFSTNLARLMDTTPDAESDLAGLDLVRRKVRLLSVMGGSFGREMSAEYNVANDIPSAKKVFESWPTPIVFSGFEVGIATEYPSRSIVDDYGYVEHHPLPDAYRLFNPPPHNRPNWDPTTVLYAVRPDREYFGSSPSGRVTVNAGGQTQFEPAADGTRRYLTINKEQSIRVSEVIATLASQPPDVRADSKPHDDHK